MQSNIIHSLTKIELLAPAKNAEIGIEAINHGADAVYIGAPLFSARAMAGNSIAEIEKLVKYAHLFDAKVLVALNTILTDKELEEAENIINDIYNAGADALIIQDMGILNLNLPPIRLHASTQCDNRTPEKVQFLQNAGFQRVVLARELNLQQIKSIRAVTQIELEAFVHGSLCVSYSGQCYMSQALCGRSANRGTCAQMCRLPYNLLDADKKILLKDKHLLSLKDMDRSDDLAEMMNAGITTFKIEGRLKDVDYVKNNVAYYRRKLDAILERDHDKYIQASGGKTYFFFEPQPQKTFYRGSTDYFLHERTTELVQLESPKSFGESIGTIIKKDRLSLTIDTNKKLANGDGLCFIDSKEGFSGCKINRVIGTQIFPSKMPNISIGTYVYRNYDHEFEKLLTQKTAERKMPVHLCLTETINGFELCMKELYSDKTITVSYEIEKQQAQKTEIAEENIKKQLSKLGGSIYEAAQIDIKFSQPWFIPNSILNDMRQKATERLNKLSYSKNTTSAKLKTSHSNSLISQQLDYRANIFNKQAELFYASRGAKEIQPAYEIKAPEKVAIMTCKYCIKYNLGWCPKQSTENVPPKEPLYLQNGNHFLQLQFDCKNCEMKIIK